MLFTGDAYDRSYDIRDTIAAWRTGEQIDIIEVDGLKVRPLEIQSQLRSTRRLTIIRSRVTDPIKRQIATST